jgi:hypothetical protein
MGLEWTFTGFRILRSVQEGEGEDWVVVTACHSHAEIYAGY